MKNENVVQSDLSGFSTELIAAEYRRRVSECMPSQGPVLPPVGFPIVCSVCGVKATVPFSPRAGWPVYCRDCYAQRKVVR